MSGRPRLLDLFCCAGGAGMGYHRAGFDVTGIDIKPQPRYPFAFVQADALEYLAEHGQEYDAIHASPPCQAYTSMQPIFGYDHPTLIEPVRAALIKAGKPYAIENVEGAPLDNPLLLCGTMFGLGVIRHRLFEVNPAIWFAPMACNHHKPVVRCGRRPDLSRQFHSPIGHFAGVAEAKEAMGIDWMTQGELAEAIPPAYTEYIGRQLLQAVVNVP